MNTQSEIYKYSNCRSFLQAYLEQKKSEKSDFSIGCWAHHLGLAGTSSLSMVLNGQRKIGKSMAQRFIEYFNFGQDESQYFSDLIRLEKVAHDPRMSVLLMEKMGKQNPHGGFRLLDVESFNSISYWYYYAVREMVHLNDFCEDYDWIAQKINFKVTSREIKKALTDLLHLGLLKRDSKDKITYSVGQIDTTNDVANEGLKRFHESMLENARTAIREIDVTDREISGVTVAIQERDLPKAKELIRNFQDQLCDLMSRETSDSVYQLNVQFFPLTKKSKNLVIGDRNEN